MCDALFIDWLFAFSTIWRIVVHSSHLAIQRPAALGVILSLLDEQFCALFITLHEHPIDVQGMIGDFETRTYSSQWMVPEEIHEQAIEALREKYDGVQEIMGREKISLLVWGIEKVWQFATGPDPTIR